MISLAKSVPHGLKPQECVRTRLHEPPPVPYIPETDKVQEEIMKLRNLQIMTSLEKDTTLKQEWDPRGLHARDSGTGCHQEAWSLQGL
jgi:hypothetical protein